MLATVAAAALLGRRLSLPTSRFTDSYTSFDPSTSPGRSSGAHATRCAYYRDNVLATIVVVVVSSPSSLAVCDP
jgi:hypothetical protein